MSARRPPISVLMPVYNGELYVRQAVESVLAQTYEDFEFVIVDDASTDGTEALLKSIRDPRLRILRNIKNLGVVGSLNLGMSEARGYYIARMDADDICLPRRFERQIAYLEQHPEISVLGTNKSLLMGGRVLADNKPIDTDPVLMKWLFHLGNPISHPTMMFRAQVAADLGQYLNFNLQYAEDFDFSHRVLTNGCIAILPEKLFIYRQHALNLTRTKRDEMIEKTALVLNGAYTRLLGEDSAAGATLFAAHLFSGVPVTDADTLDQIGALLERLVGRFIEVHGLEGERAKRVVSYAGTVWWRIVQASLRSGAFGAAARSYKRFPGAEATQPPWHRLVRSGLAGLFPVRPSGNADPLPSRGAAEPPTPSPTFELGGVSYTEETDFDEDPPRLFVVVDTEAEFNWDGGFDRVSTSVKSIAHQELAQGIFDGYGLRPIYLVDYAVASQPDGYGPLRRIFDRHGCAIGAHLHPWINPPFEEVISEYHSFAGNLPAGLEERKLRVLVTMIERNFGISPLFFKSGRYGVGPETMSTLGRLGFAVDFSILPGADLRSRGGPDFRTAGSVPYRTAAEGILSLPMSRGNLGLLRGLPPDLHATMQVPAVKRLRIPAAFSRLGLANTVTLTPEGVTAKEQIDLLRLLEEKGYRSFVLHYHSPSLAVGNTPYVQSEADLKTFLSRIETVTRFFMEELGGTPGNPADLVPPHQRHLVWPHRVPEAAIGSQGTADRELRTNS